MKRTYILTVLMGLLFIVASCAKDKRIERRLTKKDGKWNIKTMTYQYYADGVQEDSFNFNNAGSFVFDDKGSVIYNYSYDGDSGSQGGTWTNTEDEITMIFDGEVLKMKIEDDSKKEMKLVWTETYPETAESETYTFELERE